MVSIKYKTSNWAKIDATVVEFTKLLIILSIGIENWLPSTVGI